MFRIDHPTRASALPSPAAASSPGYFQEKVPTLGQPGTRVTADWLNAVQEELAAVVLAEGLVLDKGDNAQLLKVLQRLRGNGGLANLLLNPEGSVSQRVGGTINASDPGSGTAAIVGPDRWRVKLGQSTDTGSFSSSLIPSSEGIPPSGAESYLKLERSGLGNGSSTMPVLEQALEGVRHLQGAPVVLAFDVRKANGSDFDGSVELVEVLQVFGQSGSPSSTVTTTLTALGGVDSWSSSASEWRRLVFVGTLPSVAGKTITAGDHLLVRVSFTANEGSEFLRLRLTGFAFQRGQYDPGHTQRPYPLELELCSRYFEVSTEDTGDRISVDPGFAEVGLWDTAFDGVGRVRTLGRRFRTPKYSKGGTQDPTVTWYGSDLTAGTIVEDASTSHVVTSADATPTHTGFPLISSPPASGTLRQFRARWTAESEVLP